MSARLLAALQTETLAPPLPADEAATLAAELGALCGVSVYARSIAALDGTLLFLARDGEHKLLGILGREAGIGARFEGAARTLTANDTLLMYTVAPASPANAAALRALLPYTVPRPLGLRKSAGCGDRLGLATPGHIRALRTTFGTAGGGMAPILAQQSIRENARTGRTPQQVLDDALWGVFQEGWRDGYGADADHLKTLADVESCAAAGYTFFTVDPGEHVDDRAHGAAGQALQEMVDALPWDALEEDAAGLQRRLANRPIDLGDFSHQIGSLELLRAAAKYGRAVAHTAAMYRHLTGIMGDRPCELEMSVDETETVTSLAEHLYVASELRRLGVSVVSLAPRYVGTFEKGVDYIGDLTAFEESIRRHMAVSRAFGPYKLSLHSGSDKFSIYPIAARVAGDLLHLKTAGTSYLEALRAVAGLEPALFRRIVAFALLRYPTDRASYHISAQVEKVPAIADWPDARLPELLEDFHGREVLHVTFGSVLNRSELSQPFLRTLRAHEEPYYDRLEAHFHRHFAPFA